MYSQCPECLARFRVTAVALRTAQGTVRCGRCGSAFNALARLSDTLPDEDDRPASDAAAALAPAGLASLETGLLPDGAPGAPGTGGESSAVPEFHFTAADIEQVFVDARDWQRRFGAGVPDAEGPASATTPDPTRDRAARAVEEPGAPATAAPVVVHEPEAVEDITLEGERIVIEGVTDYGDEFFDELLQDAEPLPTGEDEPRPALVDLDSTDRFETLKRVPDSAYPDEADERDEPADRTDSSLDQLGQPAADAPPPLAGVAAPAAAPESSVKPEPAPVVEPAGTAVAAPAAAVIAPPPPVRPRPSWRDAPMQPVEPLEELEEESGGSRATLAWTVVALLLALVLAAQLAHRFRQELARDVTVGPLVRQAYAWAGMPLAPNWDVAAYELRQWGAEAPPDGPGLMTVRASVRNRASIAQPMPLLRLELENRFGDTVARRDFEPGEYLKDPAQASRLLDPGGSVEAELALVDVPTEAVGYRLDACLRDDQGALDCAQAPRTRAGAGR